MLQPPPTRLLLGDEQIVGTPATVRDFWAWALSDLRTNTVRPMLAEFLGVGAALGPIIGAAAAGLVFADPRRIIWTAQAATAGSSSEALPEPA